METWTKYSYVCEPDECDTMLEITYKDSNFWPSGSMVCPCGRTMQFLSEVDATINNNNTEEEAPMDKEALVDMWKQELDLTYGNEITQLTNQVNALQSWKDSAERMIESLQDRSSKNSESLGKYQRQVSDLKQYLKDNYDELDGHAEAIAQIFDIELTREIEYDIVIHARAVVEVGLDEDGEDIIRENVYIDSSHGNIVIHECDIDTVIEV